MGASCGAGRETMPHCCDSIVLVEIAVKEIGGRHQNHPQSSSVVLGLISVLTLFTILVRVKIILCFSIIYSISFSDLTPLQLQESLFQD